MIVPVPRVSISGLLVIIVLCVVVNAFNSSETKSAGVNPVQFNDALVSSQKNTALAKAYNTFLTQANYAAAGTMSFVEVRKSQDRVIQLQKEMLADMKALKAPDSKAARDFYQAYLNLRTHRSDKAKAAMDKILQTVVDPSLSVPGRQERARQLWDEVVQQERVDVRAVDVTQEAFARESGFNLLPKQRS